MELEDIQFSLLSHLFNPNRKLDSYSLFMKTNVAMSVFIKNINILQDKGLILVEDECYRLTPKGCELLVKIKSNKSEKAWRNIPKKFLTSATGTHQFYVPNTRILDKKYFHSSEKKVQ